MAKTKREQLSKKIRFDVFKRDSFTCSYCGQTPPSIILEIDHIEPVVSNAVKYFCGICWSKIRYNKDKSQEFEDE